MTNTYILKCMCVFLPLAHLMVNNKIHASTCACMCVLFCAFVTYPFSRLLTRWVAYVLEKWNIVCFHNIKKKLPNTLPCKKMSNWSWITDEPTWALTHLYQNEMWKCEPVHPQPKVKVGLKHSFLFIYFSL